MTLLVAGGGTGGHVHAGFAIAEEWKARYGKEARVVFVGSRDGIERTLVPNEGYPLYLLKLGTLNRVGLGRKLLTLIQLPFSLMRSLIILVMERPKAVVGVGGYASGPVVWMASWICRFWKGTTAILEQNSVPGMTNRILGKRVRRVFSSFQDQSGAFEEQKTLVTGNPIRSNLKPMSAGTREPLTVFIFGGSQGAVGMNTLVIESLESLKPFFGKLRFIHQTGARDYSRVLEAHQRYQTGARVEQFINDMKGAYEEASLLICRAGASTLAEIAAVGRAAILVPLPTASDNHQEKNAQLYVEAGAARLFRQTHATGKELATLIEEFVNQPSLIDEMEKKTRCFYRPDAARKIVENLLD